jgi:aminoglycoside phosphotransferase (APT) family kinase protein
MIGGLMAQWRPDIDLDEATVLALVDAQFPELDVPAQGMTRFAAGWDKSVWRVGDERSRLAFAFVHREIAIPIIEQEIRLLPVLIDRVPLPVPRLLHVGETTAAHRYPWFGFELLPGREVVDAQLEAAARDALGDVLGGFLRALHAPETLEAVAAAVPLAFDPNRRSDPSLVDRGVSAIEQVEAAGFELTAEERARALATFDALPGLDLSGEHAFVHGDLHVRHLLVDDAGQATGIIDWGDAGRAPVGLDLTLYWSELTPTGRGRFLAAYGDVSADQLALGRACATFLAAMIATSSRDLGDEARAMGAFASLQRALA